MSDSGDKRVNQGGEPGHDDYGLPRVDVQIPDDARELYRDVQAYHRELRALRRQERSRRWRTPLRKSSMIVPIIAGCLVLAMIAGMVLTMFTANPLFSGIAGDAPASSAARGAGNASDSLGRSGVSSRPPASPSATHAASGGPNSSAGAYLPDKTVIVGGKALRLKSISDSALALVPAGCRCVANLKRFLVQAKAAKVPVLVVSAPGNLSELRTLAAGTAPYATVAGDPGNALGSYYRKPALTILLVDARGHVADETSLPPPDETAQMLRSLQ